MINLGGLFKKSTNSKPNSSLSSQKFNRVLKDSQVVINAIADGVIAIGTDGNIKLINPAAEQILGWTNGDANGLSFRSIIKIIDGEGKDLDDFQNPINRALDNFKPFSSRDVFLKTQSEKSIPVLLTINPIDEHNSGIIVVFRNIANEIKENREQAEFISTASHEMRTPVASIEGYLGLTLNPATATIDERAREYINKAHESAQHLGQLFQDLLDITKSEDGRLKNDPKVIDVVEFTREIWEGLKHKADEKELQYIYLPDQQRSGEKQLAPVFYANLDKDHFREVLGNLIENAIKYTPEGQVIVNVSGDNDNIKISVQDSGIGIPAEDIPHLFQKFYRVDNSDTREIGGTGLGLYLSRRLTENFGGKLTVESEYRSGSTFTMQIPRITREEATKLSQVQAEARKHQERIDAQKVIDYKKSHDVNNANTSNGQAPEFQSLDEYQNSIQVPPEEIKPTTQQFSPNTPKPVPQQPYFSAEDIANSIKKPEPAPQTQQEHRPNPISPAPERDFSNMSLSDIEKVKEEYVKRIIRERQK